MPDLRVAIVHYHMKPGGVTRVTENAAAALANRNVAVAVLCGEPVDNPRLPNLRVVEQLAYRQPGEGGDPERLADDLEAAAREALGGLPDVWHIHNHCLGKNALMPAALRLLAERGGRMLLQIHDFAEDGRPGNYAAIHACYAHLDLELQEPNNATHWGADLAADPLSAWLYPSSSQIHYAVLNGRDRAFLARAGAPEERLHLLANPIAVPPEDTDGAEAVQEFAAGRAIYLYPTRAIRRKNLGEFLLWSALADESCLFASTLAPNNPEWLPVHDRWEAFAQERELPVSLNVVSHQDFGFLDWVAAAQAIVTTSVAEGFGLAFLEPFLFGKPLLGRDLPEITGDFATSGVALPGLYTELEVPVAALGKDGLGDLRTRLHHGLENYFRSYQRPLPEAATNLAMGEAVRGGTVEFGMIDEALQERVISATISDPGLRRDIRPDTLGQPASPDQVAKNRALVVEHFSLATYGDRLMELYEGIAAAPVEPLGALDAGALLDCFLDPRRFRLLRS